ncbi:echotoxin-2-like isoform X2 [Littorina saxatilis]|uniref:Uncharacterized protein n=2 Tax=Littorina saxatilis TaxID=31220 RepID=A0AAN9AXJ5_9CAEN
MITPAMVSAAEGAVSPGASLQQAAADTDRTVTCYLKVVNTTRFPLTDCYVSTQGGELQIPPSNIGPGTAEAMVARKKAWGTSGTYGTVSWRVGDTRYRLVVMWHCPWDFVFNDANWLGMGIVKEGAGMKEKQPTWYDIMYTDVDWNPSTKESWRQNYDGLDFHSQRFHSDITPLSFRCVHGGFQAEGTMSNGHNATAKITLVPLEKDDFAPAIKKELKSKGY